MWLKCEVLKANIGVRVKERKSGRVEREREREGV